MILQSSLSKCHRIYCTSAEWGHILLEALASSIVYYHLCACLSRYSIVIFLFIIRLNRVSIQFNPVPRNFRGYFGSCELFALNISHILESYLTLSFFSNGFIHVKALGWRFVLAEGIKATITLVIELDGDGSQHLDLNSNIL